MSERAVVEYLKTQLNGLTVSTIPAALEVVDVPPSVETLTAPILILWPLKVRETRLAGTRGTGLKTVTYQIANVLMWTIDTVQDDALQVADLKNAVLVVYRGLTLNTPLTDSVTGETSTLYLVGEAFETSTPDPAPSAAQSTVLWYTSRIDASITELVTA